MDIEGFERKVYEDKGRGIGDVVLAMSPLGLYVTKWISSLESNSSTGIHHTSAF